jgi:hypothetical protein
MTEFWRRIRSEALDRLSRAATNFRSAALVSDAGQRAADGSP